MTGRTVRFAQSTATADQIRAHLLACEQSFVPPLAGRLDIEDYAEKIARKAVTFEAWREPELAGLVAAYLNDPDGQEGFVTSVSVVESVVGRGIGAALLGTCIDAARDSGFQQMKLEVHRDNGRAIEFYQRFGFLTLDRDGDNILMRLPLVRNEPVALTGGLL